MGSWWILGGAAGVKQPEDALGDDGADLASGGGETVGGGAVTGWETFTGHEENGCVRARGG